MRPGGPALVTGAGRGLGRALALSLAARGFEVVATMRDPAAADDWPEGVRLARLDVDDPASIEIPDGLRVLVNNAGVETEYQPLEHAPQEAWRRVFETNVFGLAEVTRRAAPALRAAGAAGGAVVCNVTSASLFFPMPFYSVYRASKAAVQALSESLAAELAEHGVRVVCAMPGPIETDMLAGSDRRPEAAAHAPYRRLANWAFRGRRAAEAAKTPAAVAAERITDAILDDDAPLRVACDPVGEALIAADEATPYTERLRRSLRTLDGDVR